MLAPTPSSHPAPRRSNTALLIRLPGVDRILSISEATLVGRDASCDLQLADGNIHPRHAELYRVGSLWWVRDLGSLDGTYLDEECIDAAPVVGRSALKLGADGPTLWLEPEARRIS